MTALGEYIAGQGSASTRREAGASAAISRRELNRIIERWEWFTAARRARALITGESDPALVLPLMFWGETPAADLATQNAAQNERVAPVDVIDRFIAHGGYRIVPTDEECEVEVDIDIDPQMVTPELAEIYRSQGLLAEAEKIDRILKS